MFKSFVPSREVPPSLDKTLPVPTKNNILVIFSNKICDIVHEFPQDIKKTFYKITESLTTFAFAGIL